MSGNIILTGFEDLSEIINNPLKQTQRIKYTTSDISQNFIVFGATSGSLYLFERNPCKFIQIIPGNNGAVAQIAISNDENYVAVSTFKGTICIVTLDIIDACSTQIVAQNENNLVTCFYWDRECDDKKLYYGDSMGNVVLVQLLYLLGRTMLHTSTHSILLLETSIVQISGYDKLILVSTTTKCVLCNTEKEEFKQIGNKPRDGEYGACFILPSVDNNDSGTKIKIYCARPGMRLWEVDIEGNVLQTHQLKNYLTNKFPNQVLQNIRNDLIINNKTDLNLTMAKSSSSSSTPPSSSSESNDLSMIDLLVTQADDNNKLVNNKMPMQFSKLYSFYGKYCFAYTDNLILLFDTELRIINLLNTQFTNIKQINFIISKNRNNHAPHHQNDDKYLYILNKNMKLVLIKLNFLSEYLFLLYFQQNYVECYNLIKNNHDFFLNIIQVKNSNNIEIIKILKKLNEIFVNLNLLNNDDNNNVNILFKKLNEENGIILNNINTTSSNDANNGDDGDDDVKNEIIVVNNKINNIATQFKLNNKLLATLSKNSGDINSSSSNNDEEKIIWNLYMIYKTSKISNINFIERYTNIFDKYELKYVINLLEKLKALLHENEIRNNSKPDDINTNCIKLFFDYLKIEMIWEIGDTEREYIMKSFILINNQNIMNNNNLKCAECKFPLQISSTCEYKDIGLMLLQYYWSRKDYNTCFDLCAHVTYLMRIINKFYIDERDFSNIIPYCIIIGDIEILLKAIDIFDIQNWYDLYDFFNLYQLNLKNSRYYCLKCKKFSTLSKSTCNDDDDDDVIVTEQNVIVVTQLNWNVIFNLSIDYVKGGNALKLIDKFNETVSNDLVGRDFYLKCLLTP